jgi:hypothetical protein
MGRKNKYLIIFLLFPAVLYAQEKADFRTADSLTYKYYNSGEWDKLIRKGNESISSGIDYKFLRQRMGFAYFSKADYYNAVSHFEKALPYDSYNQFTLEYLYYSLLNSGRGKYAGILVNKIDPELRKKLNIRRFQPVESIESEFDYKYSGTALRSDPTYFRIGVGSGIGYRLSLYQSFSGYSSSVITQQSLRKIIQNIDQKTYYAMLTWNPSLHLLLSGAYHGIYTMNAGSAYRGNLFLIAASHNMNRLTMQANGSLFRYRNESVLQAGIKTSYVFPVKSDLYVKFSASYLYRPGSSDIVLNPAAGLRLWKNAWLEGNVTTGNMDRYNDFNGLYVYNTYDPAAFRSGGTFVYYLGSHVSFWLNYSYEKKNYFEDANQSFNQFSYLGGIKWKI